MNSKLSLNIRVDPEVRDKLKYIAEYEGRSMSGQILYVLNTCIREFERREGPIQLSGDGHEAH